MSQNTPDWERNQQSIEAINTLVAASTTPAEAVANLLANLTRNCGKQVAQHIEKQLFIVAEHAPELIFAHVSDSEPQIREAMAVALGRINSASESNSLAEQALVRLTEDPDKWVRMKAQRALTGSSQVGRMSPLGNACISMRLAVERGEVGALHRMFGEISQCMLRKTVRRKRPAPNDSGLLREDVLLVLLGLAHYDSVDHEVDGSTGWKGDEMFVAKIRHFSATEFEALVACAPAAGSEVFAIFIRDKFPEYCSVHYRAASSREHARQMAHSLANPLAEAGTDSTWLVEQGWTLVATW